MPVGDLDAWQHDPFGGEIVDGVMYGRGACDMKSGVAAFVACAIEFVKTPFEGSIMLLITGDEEGAGVDGTRALLDDLNARGETIDHCIVGEPTCPNKMGEMIKIGRRGSLTAYLTAKGKQGHVAYPDRAENPISPMIELLSKLQNWRLDEGYADFQPSNLELVSVDVGNTANNVIPGEIRAVLNIRYNPNHTAQSLQAEIDTMVSAQNNAMVSAHNDAMASTQNIEVRYHASGDAFLTEQGDFTERVANAVQAVTNHKPVMSTTGGTSDARFVKNHCPVVECGLVGATMHGVDERVDVAHIEQLTKIYARILTDYFATDNLVTGPSTTGPSTNA